VTETETTEEVTEEIEEEAEADQTTDKRNTEEEAQAPAEADYEFIHFHFIHKITKYKFKYHIELLVFRVVIYKSISKGKFYQFKSNVIFKK
jgi:hypothetical protein